MRAFEFLSLNESSRGLLFRAPGDVFVSQTNPEEKLEFVSATVFPEEKEFFDTPEERDQLINDLAGEYPGIVWTNPPNRSMLAFGIVTLNDPKTNKKKHFGRYFRKKMPNMAGAWKNSDIPGYSLGIKSSMKARSGLKPADLLEKDAQYTDAKQVIDSISHTDPAIKAGLEMILQNKLPEFAMAKDMEPAIRDDLGEIIAPLCLYQGLIAGQAEDARKFLLGNQPWSNCTITFPSAKNSGLIDSYLRPQKGVAIGISSKGKGGAKASVSNIWSGVELLRKSGQEDVVNKYPEAVEILDTLKRESAFMGPIMLGIKYGFCSEVDKNLIMDSIKAGIKTVPDSPRWNNLQTLMSKFASQKQNDPGYNIGFHALAGLAKMVAEHINSNVGEFSEACRTFLNSSPLLQIHLYTTSTENSVKVSRFDTIWPPQFKGRLVLDAGKNYYATSADKFSFGFKPQ